MPSLIRATGPFAQDNVRLYSWFSICFNARFYYPILAILFLDLGLTLSQFVTLNAIWAATIFLAEVPSGALADIMGRRSLLIFSAGLMIAEMVVLLVAPPDSGLLLFGFCVVNRILSGLAEAAASGADEALAYDSLENAADWSEVLEVTMRWRSGAMVIAMVVGALVYDASAIGVPAGLAHRLPIIFCLLQAIAAFFIALGFREIHDSGDKVRFRSVLAQTWKSARWVFTTKAAIFIVTGGLLIDGVVRNFATINSEFYRLIEIPTFLFGFIAAATALVGIFVPKLSKYLAGTFSPLTNLTLTAVWTIVWLFALGRAWTYWGVIPGVLLMAGLSHLAYLISRYLNELASSSQRATILSVKGLLFNVGYGTASLIFAGAVALKKGSDDLSDDQALVWTLQAQPWIFLGAFGIFVIAAWFAKLPKDTQKG